MKLVLFLVGLTTLLSANNMQSGVEYLNKGNQKKALEYFTKACKNDKEYWACNEVGLSFEKKKDYKNAFDYFKKSCLGEEPIGCTNLARMYKSGVGVEKDLKTANKLLVYACEQEEPTSCFILGDNKRACKLGLVSACIKQ